MAKRMPPRKAEALKGRKPRPGHITGLVAGEKAQGERRQAASRKAKVKRQKAKEKTGDSASFINKDERRAVLPMRDGQSPILLLLPFAFLLLPF
jgi:hypothetical protein